MTFKTANKSTKTARFSGSPVRMHFGHGTATGTDRAKHAAKHVIACSDLPIGVLQQVSGVTIVIYGDKSIRLDEIAEASDIVAESCSENAAIFLHVLCDNKGDALSVFIIVSENEDTARLSFPQRPFSEWERKLAP